MGNLDVRQHVCEAIKRNFLLISNDIPPEMIILNTVIPILMYK